jgi:hypothetical protein
VFPTPEHDKLLPGCMKTNCALKGHKAHIIIQQLCKWYKHGKLLLFLIKKSLKIQDCSSGGLMA